MSIDDHRDLDSGAAGPVGGVVGLPSVPQVHGWVEALAAGSSAELSDTERIDLLRAIEVLKCAAEGAQAELTVEFAASQRRRAAEDGVAAERQGRGVAAQVALARRESPHRGQRHVGFAVVARRETPHTWAALRAGRIGERKAMLVLTETACLELATRTAVDLAVAGDPDRIEAMGERELVGEVRKLAYAAEPRAWVERRAKAENERHTRLRAAPDTMSVLTVLLPVRDGVAVHAVLGREADRLREAGDPRGRGQLMADLLVQRVTDPAAAATGTGTTTGPPVLVNVVVSDSVLLGDSDDSGWVEGCGPVPGDLIRERVVDNLDAGVDTWLRRLYERPETAALVAMDSRARRFTGALADFLRLRDRSCRTPWCDAPVRHLDHATDHAAGGPTTAANAQGLCAACNHAKQVRGWIARRRAGPPGTDEADQPHTIETTTPTGHVYRSTAEPVGPRRPRRVDFRFPITLVA